MSMMGHLDFFKTREAKDGKDAEVLTAEEEALLQVLQTKKMRSRPGKEPINLLPNILQGSSARRPYPVFSKL